MLGLFAAVFYSVGMRYLFNRPPLWSVDVPNLIFIWMVFGVVGLTAKLGPQIRVLFFVERLPVWVNRMLLILTHCAILMMLVVFIVYSQPIIELSSDEVMLSTGWSGAWFFYALPCGCVVMGYYQIRALVLILRDWQRAR
jgi:TRAP-type C4-dicarboxylate transport system permease small subunit